MNPIAIKVTKFFIDLFRLYFSVGLFFSILFVLFGIQKMDHYAQWERGFKQIINGILFRCLIIPGLCAFWPLFAVRLIQKKGVPSECNAHRRSLRSNSEL